MTEFIIVHPGGAHLDEILSTGLICQERGVLPVHRRRPTEDELKDPEIWVVDIGLQHQPELRNFDHHQLPRDAPPICALSLVAEHLELAPLLANSPWYEAQVGIDSKGPVPLATKLGLGKRLPPELTSPFEIGLTHLWREQGEGVVDPDLVTAVTVMADGVVRATRIFAERLLVARESTEVVFVGGIPILFHSAGVPDEVSARLRDEWHADHEGTIAASVSKDSRKPYGSALSRFDDDERIDFACLQEHPKVRFAHNQGFVAKTVPDLGREELLGLIEISLVG